ncbi:hypothetical protein [Methanobrevibacter sp.]
MFSKEVLLDKYADFVRIFVFADFEADLDSDIELFQIYLEQFAASGIDVSNINSGCELTDALNAACDLLKSAILMEI